MHREEDRSQAEADSHRTATWRLWQRKPWQVDMAGDKEPGRKDQKEG